MTLSRNIKLVGICLAILATAFLLIGTRIAFGDVGYQQPGNTNVAGTYRNYNFFATSTSQQTLQGSAWYGTTTVATGGNNNQATSTNIKAWSNSSGQIDTGVFVIAGAKQLMLSCSRTATSTNIGTSTCTYQVQNSPTGAWQYLNQVTAVASSTSQVATTAVQPSLAVAAATTTQSGVVTSIGFYALRCVVTIGIDGAALCSANAIW